MRVGLPAGALGRTEGTWHALREYSIAPGAALRYRRPCDAPTLIVGYVEAGTYAVRAVGPLEVIRGGDGAVPGARIAVEAGTEVVLERGDGLVYRVAPGEDRSGFRNPGPGGLLVLEWVWWGEAACPLGRVEDAPPENMRPRWDNFGVSPPLDPTQALTLRFRRIAAGPGAVLPEAGPEGAGVLPGHAAGMELLVVTEGRVASSVRKGPGEAASSEVVFVPHHGVAGTEDLPAGMSRVLRNAGDGPLVLVALTITPDEGAGTPAAG